MGPMEALQYWQGNEFQGHIRDLQELLNFRESREIFDDRIKFLRGFMHRFQIESEGRIFPQPGQAAACRCVPPAAESNT